MTLGIAMLARNCAADLPRALEPFLGQVDDVAILLGGRSTDNTAEVARHYGRVDFYTGPLTDEGGLADFGMARQQNFDMLATDYALMLDSDDIWAGVERLPEVKADALGYEAVLFPYDLGEGVRFLQSRLFRRDSGYWSSPVHEQWNYYSAPNTKTLTVNAMTVRQEKRGDKLPAVWRNIRIAEARLNEVGFDYRLLSHLPHEYILTKQYRQAIEAAGAILERRDELKAELTPERIFQLYYTQAMAYLCLEEYEAGVGVIMNALSHANYGNGWTLLAELANLMGVYDLALYAADRALALGHPVDIIPIPYANISSVPYFIKAKALEQMDRKMEAITAANLGLALKPEPEIINLKNRLCAELGVIP